MSLGDLDFPVVIINITLPLDIDMSEFWEVKNVIYSNPSVIDQRGLCSFC